MNIGKKLAGLRRSFKLSQDELANKLHVSRQTISNWETGKTYPDINSLVMLSDIFDLSLDELIREDLPLMKNRILQNKIRWLSIGSISLIVLTYLCLFVLKYSLVLGSLLVGASTVYGLVLIFRFIKTTNSVNLKTFTQVINYLKDTPTDSESTSKKTTLLQYILGALLGITFGAILTWLIFKFGLGINLF